MSFFQKIGLAFKRFMFGRNGGDQLSLFLLYLAITMNLLALIPHLQILSTLSLVVVAIALFRMFSKNTAKRYAENQKFLKKINPVMTYFKQARVRFKNRKIYAYFSCPHCHAKLRLPRNVGEVTVTCGKCGYKFRKKA